MPVPFFSIIIPTYNRADFIADTLRSVFAQVFSSFELIVVDDGSKDNTSEVVQLFKDPRLRYYVKENAERGAARNYGLRRAKGEYAIFLDSDDLFLPNHLATLYGKIQELGQPNFIATKYQFKRNGMLANSELAGVAEGTYGIDFFVRGNALACNFCVRRQNPALKLFEEDRRYAAVEDWMFLLENTQQDHIYLIDTVTLIMNDHDERSMRADNSGLVRRLELAVTWMERLQLTPAQRCELLGHVHYLCAVHCYMDNHRKDALRHWRKAWGGAGWRRELPLLARIVAGPVWMTRVKQWVS